MSKFSISMAIIALLLAKPDTALAEKGAARSLIKRAVEAMGGAEALQQKLAVRWKYNGWYHIHKLGEAPAFEGEGWKFGQRCKVSYWIAGADSKTTLVFDGANSHAVVNGQLTAFDKDQIEQQRKSDYVDRVTDLTDLLTDKGFSFAPLADVLVDRRTAAGIKVAYKGQPDVNLYFDKENGFLVKYAYRTKRFFDTQEVFLELVLSDYRVLNPALADEKILRTAMIDVSGSALTVFLRKQTPSKAVVERVRTQIDKLGNEVFQVRERASRDVVAAGSVAVPLLREATKSTDAEIVRRARLCLRQIEQRNGKVQIAAAVCLMAHRRPNNAAEVLLDYLPAAEAEVADEVRAALFALAHDGDKADPILMRALHAKEPERRAAAAAALGKDGGVYARRPGRRVLPHPFQIPMKLLRYADGRQEAEIEYFAFEFFNAFEDKLFAKP